jgi:tape measure domain-containing protein
MAGSPLAEAFVRISVDLKNFENEFRAGVTKAAKAAGRVLEQELGDAARSAVAEASAAFDGLAGAAHDAARSIGRDLTRVRADLDGVGDGLVQAATQAEALGAALTEIDDASFMPLRRELDRVQVALADLIREATHVDTALRFEADTSAARAEIALLERQLGAVALALEDLDGRLVDLDTLGARAALDGLQSVVADALVDVDALDGLNVDLDATPARVALAGISAAAEEANAAIETALELDAGAFVGQAGVITRALGEITSAGQTANLTLEAVDLDGGQIAAQAGIGSSALTALAGVAKGAALGVGGIVAAAGLTGAALAGLGLKGAGELEQIQTAFTGLFGSLDEADAFIKKLQDFAATTPFEFDQLTGSTQQLIAALGQTQDESIATLRTIGNAAAAAGKGGDAIAAVIAPLTQIGSLGKVTADNLNQISNALPNFSRADLIENLAEALGKTNTEVAALLETGGIPADVGIPAILQTLREVPGAAVDAATGLDAMGRQSQTLNGLLSTLSDTVKIRLTTAFQPLADVVKTQLPALTEGISGALDTLAPAVSGFVGDLLPILVQGLEPIGELFAGVFGGLTAVLDALVSSGAFDALGQAAADLAPVFVSLGSALGQVSGPLLTAVGQIVSALAGPLAAALDVLGPALGTLAASIGGLLVTAFEALAPLMPPLATALAAIADALAVVFTALEPVITVLGGVLADVITALAPVVADLATILGDVLAQAAERVGDVLVTLAPSISEVVGLLGDLLIDVLAQLDADTIEQLVDAFLNLALAGADLAVALVPLLPPLIRLASVLITEIGVPTLLALVNAFASLAVALSNIVTPAADLAAVFVDKVLPPLSDFADFMDRNLGPIIDTVVGFLGDLVDAADDLVGTFRDDLQPVIEDVTDVLDDLWNNILRPLGRFLAGSFASAVNIVLGPLRTLADVFGDIKDAALEAYTTIKRVVGGIGGAIGGAVAKASEIVGGLIALFVGMPGTIARALSGLGAIIGGAFTAAFRVVTGILGPLIGGVVGFFTSLPGRISGALSGLGSILSGAFRSAFGGALGLVGGLVGDIVGKVGALPARIAGLAGDMLSAGSRLIGSLIEGLGKVVGGAAGIAKGIANSIIGFLNRVIDSINDRLEFKIPLPFGRSFNVNPPDIGHIPTFQFARGAIVDRPTPGIFGEAGAEALLPLTKPARFQHLLGEALTRFPGLVRHALAALPAGAVPTPRRIVDLVAPSTAGAAVRVAAATSQPSDTTAVEKLLSTLIDEQRADRKLLQALLERPRTVELHTPATDGTVIGEQIANRIFGGAFR